MCWTQYSGQTPPAPIRGAALKKQAAGGGDDDEPAEVEEVNVADLIPRTDISGSITESLINELNDKNWKVGHSVSKKQRNNFVFGAARFCSFWFFDPIISATAAKLRVHFLELWLMDEI